MFGKERREEKTLEAIREDIRQVAETLARLEGKRKGVSEELGLSEEIKKLKREIAQLEIDKSKLTEEHERKVREVEHKVGLVQKRQDFEIEAASRDVELKVREEALAAERERFEKQMDFVSERFAKEIDYLKEIMDQIMLRLPNVEVALNGNGGGDKSSARRATRKAVAK
jgi:hypothetical protein